jgi:hypothetical protein
MAVVVVVAAQILVAHKQVKAVELAVVVVVVTIMATQA